MDSGEVQAEQKYGNGNADVAADKGATKTQKLTYAMARHYSLRHYLYRTLMVRIQKMIVELKKCDREMRDREKKEADPFETGSTEAVLIPMQLEHAVQEDATTIEITEVGEQWASNGQHCKKVRK